MAKIELTPSTRYALEGHIVTLDKDLDVVDSGVVYIEGDKIVDVRKSAEPPPAGFSPDAVIKTGGTIYPGLIELHNHLSYNIVSMWMVPKPFGDRDQWRTHQDYRKKMTGPLDVLGGIDGYLQAIVRYVECKLLFSGVTSSQGITLASHSKITQYYKGIVRNVEQSVDKDLPAAEPRIADVKNAEEFLKLLKKEQTCYLLHLAEGIPARANKHFRALQVSPNEWAIRDTFAGIHAVGLLPSDFKVMRDFKGSIVWSPMSNLMLYGVTADVASAKENELLIGLGSDWSASGSKNLLCELKVAKLFSEKSGQVFTDEELVRMVTTNAARILKWDKVGSLKPGMKADLIVVGGQKKKDQYAKLIEAQETDIAFVVIGGLPRMGVKKLMGAFNISLEEVKLGSQKRYLFLKNEVPNVVDIQISFADARKKLETGMRQLPELAKAAEAGNSGMFAGAASATRPGTTWHIFPDHEDLPDSSQRLHLPYDGEMTGGSFLEGKALPLSQILEPLDLDPPTIADDHDYFKRLALQKNLPEYLKLQLPVYYGQTIDLSAIDSHIKNLGDSALATFDFVQPLRRFYDTPGYLSTQDRLTITDQATVLLEQAYVHLPLKKARHAANPLERLAILRHRIQQEDGHVGEIEFHKEMISIFNSLRDLHTTYQLPEPFNDKLAFLPFFIEEYSAQDGPRYTVSKLIGKSPSRSFTRGVEITHWNGIPIERAIELNGNRYAGSNPAARHARGLDTMTFRPLAMMLPPDEEWVTVSYVTDKGRQRHVSIPWLVGSIYSSIYSQLRETDKAEAMLSSGYDNLGRFVQSLKRNLFAPKRAVMAEVLSKEKRERIGPSKAELATAFPGNLAARKVRHGGREFGYIRIYTFATDDPEGLAREFGQLLRKMPRGGVILDVRGNGGGNILAAEWMLQSLAPDKITSQPAEFINTELVEEICRMHSPSRTMSGLDLSPWYESIKEIKQTGSVYTLGYPITPPSTLRSFRAKRGGKFLLITDALCYSATDIFAAGFKDHELGKILGTHDNTGAGGANVWTHSLLRTLTKDAEAEFSFKPLPYNANFTVAVRRTLRVGPNSGIPVEDLGVKPDRVFGVTKDDLLFKNRDLIATACEILAQR
jgi:cytosine/adenosine deaminase-related metal-dependent hydrolase/C-terminal processing protease CtpA/Prc